MLPWTNGWFLLSNILSYYDPQLPKVAPSRAFAAVLAVMSVLGTHGSHVRNAGHISSLRLRASAAEGPNPTYFSFWSSLGGLQRRLATLRLCNTP